MECSDNIGGNIEGLVTLAGFYAWRWSFEKSLDQLQVRAGKRTRTAKKFQRDKWITQHKAKQHKEVSTIRSK